MTTAPMTPESTTDSDAVGIRSSALFGVTPYYEDAFVTLYHGDSLALIEKMSLGQVDVIITDPPYGTGTGEIGDWTRGEFSGDFTNAVLLEMIPRLYRVTKPNGAIYAFTSWMLMADWILRLREYFKLQGFIVWDKGRHSGTFGKFSWQFHWEGIIYGLKGRREIIDYQPDILRVKPENGHAMQKPVALLEKLITASTTLGELVFDPFSGTGATLVAAKRLGRKAIGFELLEDRCAIAAGRLSQEMDFHTPNKKITRNP